MRKQWRLTLHLLAAFLVLLEQTQTAGKNVASVQRVRRQAHSSVAGNSSLHIHIHHDENITSTNEEITNSESSYFISNIFEKQGHSDKLSLDGFARILCSLGLVPSLAETTNEADDSQTKHLDCDEILFDQVENIFALMKSKEKEEDDHEGDTDDHSDHDHADGHSDHDHQPKGSRSGGKVSGRSGHGATHSGEGGEDHHNHTHDDHHHDHDHGHHHDHDHDHDSHHHDDGFHHPGDEKESHSHTHGNNDHRRAGSSQPTEGAVEGARIVSKEEKRKKRAVTEATASPVANQTRHVHPSHATCSSPSELLEFFHIPMGDLSMEDFAFLCPALLYQLDSKACHGVDDHDHDHHDHQHDNDEVEEEKTISGKVWGYSMVAVTEITLAGLLSVAAVPIMQKVWGYSMVAVTLISLAGLVGVAAVPIMQKVFYNHLLQFLVAMAVGALSGDALLHLLPHALAKNLDHDHGSHNDGDHSSHGDDHFTALWKGSTALLCIFFFFFIERILTIVTEKKRRKKTMNRLKKKRCERLCNKENSNGVGAKLSAHEKNDNMDCEQMVMVVHPNRALKAYADATHEVVMHECDETLSQAEQAFEDDEQDDEQGALGHSHAHRHGHTHCDTVPGSVAAVAWMLIVGDGIHNFSDGLAIGAAFASSVTGGVSTSIAIFCHELPHEIGDFAVLLRAGMTVKQAIVYNCISSILCFVGMVIGVAIGNLANASLWIFAGVAGMFLYIALVDMLPEMTAVETKKGENPFLHLLLQVLGMLVGAGIMFVIAAYEHELKTMLDN